MARAAEPNRWVSALTSANEPVAGADAQRRIAELEQRIKELEAKQGAAHGAGKSPELSASKTRNAELTARNRELSLENQELVSRGSPPLAAAVTCTPPSDADPRAQLRYWARQLRDDDTAIGRLPADWNSAVNILLRRQRELDPRNPWREP